MRERRFVESVKRAYRAYDRMMEKQGFYVVLTICVLVIALSAFFTFRLRGETDDAQQQPEALSVGGAQDSQTLAEALIVSGGTPLTVPTEPPFSFVQPLSGFTVRTFSDSEPQFFPACGAWKLHMGIDLETEYGSAVVACAGGKVTAVLKDGELGLCVRIDHQNGYESLYAGLDSAAYVSVGDPVAKGQTIGHAGNGVLSESDGQPHLHLEIHKNGRPVDPLAVFLGLDD